VGARLLVSASVETVAVCEVPTANLQAESNTLSPDAVSEVLDSAALSEFHRRAVLVSGAGFFTDAYDLFVIGTVATLVSVQWHLGTTQTSFVSGAAILGAFFGAVTFGRLADRIGRKKVYAVVAAVMILGALSSALANGLVFLVAARFVLGLGVGGDYPVSAVLMSEYSNRRDRGRLVGLVFSMQAAGLVVGPLVALALLGLHAGDELTWRLLLGLGSLPAAAVVYLRSKMPESPRFRAQALGEVLEASADLLAFSGGSIQAAQGSQFGASASFASASSAGGESARKLSLLHLLADRHLLRLLVGSAGCWFVFDYAYYGNTLSLPAILKGVDPDAALPAKLAWSLVMFVAFAVPGYAVAVWKLDRIGHRKLQVSGFTALAAAFGLLAAVPALTSSVGAFLAVFGLSYFFVEFGPNMTTFVLPSEIFPLRARATGHGVAAGIGKLGAFAGVFVVPALQARVGLRGMLAVAAAFALVGIALSYLLPEPAGRSLEEVSSEKRLRLRQPSARFGFNDLS
jgi:PHS family inorganic phosphate transporter-like MFS transporter